ncbi:hypothetical protein [Corynebacterium sp. KPL4072]|uniref:hypothetical protein n=1 Tax=Corynebacterium sp. KPL4072 TaxID=3135440 RepID=UPI0030C9FBAA
MKKKIAAGLVTALAVSMFATPGGWGRQAAGKYHADIHTFDWNHLTIKWMKFVW